MELMTRTRLVTLLIAGMLVAGTANAAKVYRWVDENGEVHYSESLPPDFKEEGHDVLNSRGIIVNENLSLKPPPPKEPTKEDRKELPRDASGLPRPKALYSEVEMQNRMDNFLMLRYESEQEITDAMNVEIKQLEYDRRLLRTTRESMLDTYRGEIKQAANRQRAGLEVPQKKSKEIKQLRSRLAESEASLNQLKERELAIRAEFGKQLERYRYLEKEWSEESSDS